jgi:hypothetical protein
MFSMPPAIAERTFPARISSAALAIAWASEPQTRFTVIAGTLTAARRRLLPGAPNHRAGLDDVAHDGRVDVRAAESGTPKRLADRRGAESWRSHILQGTAVCSDRGAHGMANDDFSGWHFSVPLVSPPIRQRPRIRRRRATLHRRPWPLRARPLEPPVGVEDNFRVLAHRRAAMRCGVH